MALDDGLARALSANCGHAYVAGARATGRPWRVDEDLLLSDLGLPIPLPPNNATVLTAPDDHQAAALAERVDGFFAGRPGGGYQVWSLWPSLDLGPLGFAAGRAPCMIRDPANEMPGPPDELEIVEVQDDAGMKEAWRIVDRVFCDGLAPEPAWDARVLGEDYRVWVGRVDGHAVTTSTASVSDGFVGVYAVATLAEARGRGYGEAITWAATSWRPDLPATLQASDMGRPVYERMGYRTVATFTIWVRPTRPSGRDPRLS